LIFYDYGDNAANPMADKTLNYLNNSALAYTIRYAEFIGKQKLKKIINVNGKYYANEQEPFVNADYPTLPLPATLDFCNPIIQ